ncbi:hypothetical protein LPJ57_004393, partial [Coemansia sp. RSA 486]
TTAKQGIPRLTIQRPCHPSHIQAQPTTTCNQPYPVTDPPCPPTPTTQSRYFQRQV